MDIYEYLTKEKEKILERLVKEEDNVKEEQDERIVFNIRYNKLYLYLINREQKRKYIRKEEYKKYHEEIKKAYYLKQIKFDRMYLTAINAFLANYNPKVKKSEEFLQISGDIAKILFPEINILSKKLSVWFEANYISEPPYPEKRILKTLHGEKVRSKTEGTIADSLLMRGVPYRYEWKTEINGIIVHPDFVIRHPKSGKFFIWEHFGRADDENYLLEGFKKLEIYAKAGYVVGKNLIITTETLDHPLDSDTINQIIKRYFLD